MNDLTRVDDRMQQFTTIALYYDPMLLQNYQYRMIQIIEEFSHLEEINVRT